MTAIWTNATENSSPIAPAPILTRKLLWTAFITPPAGWVRLCPQTIIYGSVPRMNFRAFVEGSAFKLNVDGMELFSHWSFLSFDKEETEKGLHAVVRLHHEIAQIDVAVHTLLDGHGG